MDIEMFCVANRIRLNDGYNRGPRRNRQNEYRNDYRDDEDRYDRSPVREQGKGNRGQGKGGQRDQGQGQGGDRRPKAAPQRSKDDRPQPRGRQAPDNKPPPKDRAPRDAPKDSSKEKPEKVQDAKGKEPEKAPKPAASAPPAAPATTALRESVYWRYGPFPPNSRAARRTKNKVKLGTHGLKKLAQLDGKKWDKDGPIFPSSLDTLAHALSFVSSLERWKLRAVAPAFALAFQLDPAWTNATLEPTNSFQGPWIVRDHLPTQLDVMHKHRDVLTYLSITGYDGLQGALLQNFTSLITLKIYSSGGCTGLNCIPKSVKHLHVELCTIKGEASALLESLKESHPEIEVNLVKCADDKKPEGAAEKEKGNPFKINLHLAAGAIQDLP